MRAVQLGVAPTPLVAPGQAATLSQPELQQRYDQKMGEAWLKNAAWITDYDAARAKAKAAGKPMFAYFTRSYSP